MADLMEFVKERQGELSNEKYANTIGLTGTTLWRYHAGKTNIDVSGIQKFSEFYIKKEDAQMIGALIAYSLGIKLEVEEINKIGEILLPIFRNAGAAEQNSKNNSR